MQLEPWVESIMAELPVRLQPSEYNAICDVVISIGEQRGRRLMHAIGVAIERGQREAAR